MDEGMVLLKNDNETLPLKEAKVNVFGAGAEVAQVYVRPPQSSIFRPVQELKAFTKVFLKAVESKTVTLPLDTHAFAHFNTTRHDWVIIDGDYEVCVSSSSRDIRGSATVSVEGIVPEEISPEQRAALDPYYTGDVRHVPSASFEALLGYIRHQRQLGTVKRHSHP